MKINKSRIRLIRKEGKYHIKYCNIIYDVTPLHYYKGMLVFSPMRGILEFVKKSKIKTTPVPSIKDYMDIGIEESYFYENK